jgi:phosphoglycolate phosphatase
MIKLIIFDLDGTLIDSLADIADAANNVLTDHSLPPFPKERYRYFVGNGLQKLIGRIVPPGTSDTLRKELAEDFKRDYLKRWNKVTRPYPGILPMLQALAARKIGLALLSNKPQGFTTRCVEEFFPPNYFSHAYGQDVGIPLKPDPAGARKLAQECDCSVTECLFVGDTAVDIETGKNAGMISMGVTWGFRERTELLQAGADIIIDNPEELIAYVERTP